MTSLYSKRVLLPFVGVVQIADLGWARALSLNGIHWTVRYRHHENGKTQKGRFNYDPRVNIALMLTIEHEQMKCRQIRTDLDPNTVVADAQRVFDVIQEADIPFAASDTYEYWLLDSEDDSPLALLHSCIDQSEFANFLPPPVWQAITAAELEVADPQIREDGFYQPPVNYRFQEVVEKRAGNHPRGAWFNRARMKDYDYPSCLIKENWDDAEDQRLCDLYLQRLAPRLLMLNGLPNSVRERLEISACQHAHDVESFYHLYPDVVNEELLTKARVEARLRKSNEN